MQKALGDIGDVLSRQVQRRPEGDGVSDGKVGFNLKISSAATMKPRIESNFRAEAADVDRVLKEIAGTVAEVKGRSYSPLTARNPSGQKIAKVTYDVPLASRAAVEEAIRRATKVISDNPKEDETAPDGKLALCRITLIVGNNILVPDDEQGSLRNFVSFALRALFAIGSFLIAALIVVLPCALVFWVCYRIVRPLFAAKPEAAIPAAVPPEAKG
jgi:hypothetical protein